MVSKKSPGPDESPAADEATTARAYRPSAKLARRMGSGPLMGPLAGRGADESPAGTATQAPVGAIQDVMAALRVTAPEEEAPAK